MTEPEEKSGRRRHVLKRSSLRESEPESTAVEPASGAIEEPVVAEPAEPAEPVVAEEVAEPAESVEDTDSGVVNTTPEARSDDGFGARKAVAFIVLPVLAVALAVVVGWLAYLDISSSRINDARAQAIQTAKDSTIALLSYNPDTVEQQLTDARGLLTGEFKDSYTSLTTDVVIPGAKEQRISAVATVPAAAAVSTEPDDAVVMVFVNQTVVVGDTEPTATLSSVRVTLENVDGTWLISKFDPV